MLAMKRSIWHSDYQSLRQVLKQIRLEAGYTQTELALQLEKPQSFVAKYENGDRNLDFLEVLDICQLCGISAEMFIQRYQTLRKTH